MSAQRRRLLVRRDVAEALDDYCYDVHRNDAFPPNAFFNRQLEYIRPKIFETQFAELKMRQFVPVNNEVPNGAEEHTYRVFTEVGQAQVIASYASDAPRVDVFGTETTSKFRSIASAYGWNFQEIRAAMMAGTNLDVRKARACRNAIERKLDAAGLIGDTSLNVTGLFNQSGTVTYTIPVGALNSKLWSTKTSEEILDDMRQLVRKIVVDSLEIEIPDTLLLPVDSYDLIANKKVGDGENRTILQVFLGTQQYVRSCASSNYLATAGSGSTRRMVVYKRSPDKLEHLISQEFEQFAPQLKGMETVTICHARTGGVVVYNPKSIGYADGF